MTIVIMGQFQHEDEIKSSTRNIPPKQTNILVKGKMNEVGNVTKYYMTVLCYQCFEFNICYFIHFCKNLIKLFF